MIAGVVLLVLSYVTKLFYTSIKPLSVAAGADLMSEGGMLLAQADVGWDETGIVLDSTGQFTKWTSTKLYRDTVGGPVYSYDLVKQNATGKLMIKTSNTGMNGISLDGSTFLTNMRTATQTWASFPRYENDTTILIAFACPSVGTNTLPCGMGFWHYGDSWVLAGGHLYDTCIDTSSFNRVEVVGILQKSNALGGVKVYTTADGTVLTNNVSTFVYSDTLKSYTTYFNGTIQPFPFGNVLPVGTPLSATNIRALTSQTTQPKIDVGHGRTLIGGSYALFTGTVYAAYVFGRVLSATEVGTVSSYLQQKYFAPALKYPATISVAVGTALSSPVQNALIVGAAPIMSYSISPNLPRGLELNTTTGDISGTPTEETPSTPYVITATNAIASSSASIMIQTAQSANKTGMLPPNTSLSSTSASVKSGEFVSSPMPTNSGGVVAKYTIQPPVSDPGLTFNADTGVLLGFPTINGITSFTITGSNVGGGANTTFKLQVGTIFTYPDSIRVKVNALITPLIPSVTSVDGTSVTITKFAYTGDLHGLVLDTSTGVISGSPNTSGISDVIVTATIGATSVDARISVSVTDESKEFKHKTIYVGAGGAAIGVGTGLLGASLGASVIY